VNLDSAWIGLAGVALGVIGTLVTTWMTTTANGRHAKEARREEHEHKVRELAAEAYVAAIEAVQWLSIMHVEDSIDPQFADEYLPKTEHAVARLRDARAAMTRVTALGGGGEVSKVAGDIAVALNVLDDAWHSAQDYRRRILAHKGPSTKSSEVTKRLFDREYERLQSSRKALSGFDGGDLPYKEIDQGNVLEGSLLSQLRQITAGSAHHS